VQILINGLISGSAIALLALAFQTVYLPTRVFFIALGGLYSAAPYFALAVEEAGGMALAVAVSIAGGVGLRFSANGQAMPGWRVAAHPTERN